MAALVLLCGCGRSAEMSAEDVRAHFASLDSCTAHLKIISDLDESVLEFESDYVYNREDSDSFTLTAPESVAGIGGRISGEENRAFTLNDLRYAVPAQVWSERTNGESLLVLRYENADDSVEKQVWLRQSDLQPVYVELYADGARVLTIQVESCQ